MKFLLDVVFFIYFQEVVFFFTLQEKHSRFDWDEEISLSKHKILEFWIKNFQYIFLYFWPWCKEILNNILFFPAAVLR